MSDGSAQAWNMKLISQSDLGGFGNGGEGLALQATADGRRIMYVAHESGPKDFTALDVTDPSEPIIVAQTEVPNDRVRSNSLDMVDDLLLVAYQGKEVGDAPVGMGIWDGDEARYYPYDRIPANVNAVLAEIAGRQVVVYLDPSAYALAAAYIATDGIRWEEKTLRFSDGSYIEGGVFHDSSGERAQIDRPLQIFTRWYGFSLTFPETEIYGR